MTPQRHMAAIKDALAAGPTPGPWVNGNADALLFGIPHGNGTEPIGFVYGPSFPERSELGMRALATSGFIAAANPAALSALLGYVNELEKDAMRYRWLQSDPRADVRIVTVGKREGDSLSAAIDALKEQS